MALYIDSKFKIKGLTVEVQQFNVCNECTVIAINNVQDLTISTEIAVSAGIK